jgi:hypothetical protein
MFPECNLLLRYNTRTERYRTNISCTSVTVNIAFLPVNNFYTSDMLLDQYPLKEPPSSVYSTQIASIRWFFVWQPCSIVL